MWNNEHQSWIIIERLEQPSCLILSDVFVSLLVFQGASGAVDARLASMQPGHGMMATESLLSAEKRCLLSGAMKDAVDIIKLWFKDNAWKAFIGQIVALSKRMEQLKLVYLSSLPFVVDCVNLTKNVVCPRLCQTWLKWFVHSCLLVVEIIFTDTKSIGFLSLAVVPSKRRLQEEPSLWLLSK